MCSLFMSMHFYFSWIYAPRQNSRPCAHLNVTISGAERAFPSVTAVCYSISGL